MKGEWEMVGRDGERGTKVYIDLHKSEFIAVQFIAVHIYPDISLCSGKKYS